MASASGSSSAADLPTQSARVERSRSMPSRSALREHKAEVLTILREAETDRIEERAAILQFDAYLSRREAERRARNEQHPANGGNAA